MEPNKHQIKIGPEFFAKAANDYNCWIWAIVREFFQNCIDCGSSRIDISITENSGKTFVVFSNDGEAMTKEILVNKLLALGASGKTDRSGDSVGGFGKAKEILYFMHEHYVIRSGQWLVSGSGAEYELEEQVEFHHGTRSTVQIDEDVVEKLCDMVKRYVSMLQWKGTVTLNHEQLDCRLIKGFRRKEDSFGVVYTNRTFSRTMIVRINGVPMFHDWISFDGCVLVELSSDSLDCLTSNRDSLKGDTRWNMQRFVNQLAADKMSALRDVEPRYTHFAGETLSFSIETESKSVTEIIQEPCEVTVTDQDGNEWTMEGTMGIDPASITAKSGIVEKPTTTSTVSFDFILKNETSMEIPKYYLPGDKMSNYARKLLMIWAKLVQKTAEVLNRECEFSVGFVFSEDCEAQYEKGNYGDVFYLNPSKVVTQSNSSSRSFEKRFKLTDRDQLIMLALHEFVHFMGYSSHDEVYASNLTDLAAVVMKNRKRFNSCF